MMGDSPEQVLEELMSIGIDGIGANCGQGIEAFLPICSRLRQATDLPIWMKPNAGLPEIVDDKTVFRTTAREFVQYIPELIQAGAGFIGGCCGTDQGFVEAIRETVDNL
jgi:5-methyltetrahydrofolate--homocysteine methyltransferase